MPPSLTLAFQSDIHGNQYEAHAFTHHVEAIACLSLQSGSVSH